VTVVDFNIAEIEISLLKEHSRVYDRACFLQHCSIVRFGVRKVGVESTRHSGLARASPLLKVSLLSRLCCSFISTKPHQAFTMDDIESTPMKSKLYFFRPKV
jgi:hypothetical protein